MKILAIPALLLASLAQPQMVTLGTQNETIDLSEDFRAEKLSDEEVKTLDDAQKKFKEAEQQYNATIYKVKVAHGAGTIWPPNFCMSGPIVSSQIRGHYILLSSKTVSCSALANLDRGMGR